MADIDIRELRKQCITSLHSCAENVAKYLLEDKQVNFENLKAYMDKYSILEVQQEVAEQALEAAKVETDVSNIDTLENRFQDGLTTLSQRRANPNSHRYMQELKTKYECGLRRVASSEIPSNECSEELTIVNTQDQFLDPLTKKPISDPVKNTMCGHVYERSTIIELIRRKNRVRCPVAGCGNPERLQENHLLEDEELRFRALITQNSTMMQ